MAKEKMVFFRKALNGFNKQDVNTYIEKLNAEFADRERGYKRKLDAAEDKCADFEQTKIDLANAQTEIDVLQRKLAESENLIAAQTAQLAEKDGQIASLEAVNANATAEAEALTAQLESLTEAIQKSEKYDGISGQIGEIILSAKTSAEEIVSKAKKDAEGLRARAEQEMHAAADSFNARAATAAYAIKNHMKKLAHDSYANVAAHAAETSDMLRDLAAHISGAAEELDTELTEGKSEAETLIDTEVSKVFNDEHRLRLKK